MFADLTLNCPWGLELKYIIFD